MDNLAENSQERYFALFQSKYSSLNTVYIENNNIVFPNGLIPLDQTHLEKVPEKIFLFKPESIYIYLSQKLYEPLDVDVLPSLNTQMEKEKRLVKIYISKFKALVNLFYNEEGLKNDPEFMKDLLQRKKAIDEARQSSIFNFIINDSEEQRTMQNENNGMNPNVSNANSQSLNGPAKALKLVNPSVPSVSPISQEIMDEYVQNNGGFTSIILVIIVTLGFGVYLALTLLK